MILSMMVSGYDVRNQRGCLWQ